MQKEKESMVGRRLYALIIDTLLLIVVGFLLLYIVFYCYSRCFSVFS